MSADEFALLARLQAVLPAEGPAVLLGVGDDAAVVQVDGASVVVAVDAVVEGVHARRDVSTPADIGWKALAVNVSDLAAMGADPVAAVVALQRPPELTAEDAEGLYDGMAQAAARWGATLVGGDIVDAPRLALSVTALGSLGGRAPLTRSGAVAGQALVCVGAVGAASAALAQLEAGVTPAPALLAAHRRPTALPDAGRELSRAGATAAIDVSDGLGADLAHLCRGSGVAARVRADALPLPDGFGDAAAQAGADPWQLALGGGEDFALLAAVPAEVASEAASRASAAEAVPAAVVGEFVPADTPGQVTVELPDGSRRDVTDAGWRHGRR